MQKNRCSEDDCQGEAQALGLCAKHYRKKRYYARKDGTWEAPKCPEHPDRPVLARGVCASCYGTQRMAAKRAEVRKAPRLCECGCGKSLVGKRPNAKYATIRCKERVAEKKRVQEEGYSQTRAKRYQATSGQYRARYLKWAYDLTPEEYDELLHSQGGGCAICGVSAEGIDGRGLHVDHCHTSGLVRGILCNNCNNGLGRFKDDPERIRKAIEYLESFLERLDRREAVGSADRHLESGDIQPGPGDVIS